MEQHACRVSVEPAERGELRLAQGLTRRHRAAQGGIIYYRRRRAAATPVL